MSFELSCRPTWRARDHLDAQDGVAAELEEVVVQPDPFRPRHLSPDVGEPAFSGGAGRRSRRSARGGSRGSGRARRSIFPLDVRGQRGQDRPQPRATSSRAAGDRRAPAAPQSSGRRPSRPPPRTTLPAEAAAESDEPAEESAPAAEEAPPPRARRPPRSSPPPRRPPPAPRREEPKKKRTKKTSSPVPTWSRSRSSPAGSCRPRSAPRSKPKKRRKPAARPSWPPPRATRRSLIQRSRENGVGRPLSSPPASARARSPASYLKPGDGKFVINGRQARGVTVPRPLHQTMAKQPLAGVRGN